MKKSAKVWFGFAWILITCALSGQPVAHAEDDIDHSPLRKGSYVGVLGSVVLPDNKAPRLDDGVGPMVALGYRNSWYALEIAGSRVDLGGTTQSGYVGSVLLFPFSGALRNAYGVIGAGALENDEYPAPNDSSTVTVEGGIGNLFPVRIGRYEFGIRLEGRFRHGHRDKRLNDTDTDLAIPRSFNDTLINVGLQFPIGRIPPPPPAAPAPVVVPVAAICSDGQDNDRDGLTDYPQDPGCSGPDDQDETDLPSCSDGKDNDGDGLIDFPADKGCTAADDPEETDPCKTPKPGERISLKGCGTGDIIVLRGVNFEFDQARLTVNAKSILDNVAEELTAYPDIEIELGGHTDAKGADEYNRRLSDTRANSVRDYLVGRGINPGRMRATGFGESQPVADNDTAEGRELNRRVELKIERGAVLRPPQAADGASVTPSADSP